MSIKLLNYTQPWEPVYGDRLPAPGFNVAWESIEVTAWKHKIFVGISSYTTVFPNPMGERVSSPIHPHESLCFTERWNKTRGQHNHSHNFNLNTRLNVSWDVLNSAQKLLLVLHKKADTPQMYRLSGALKEPSAQLHTDTELNPSPPANFTMDFSGTHSILSHWATHYR